MKIRDVIEGYFTLKYLQRKGFVEDDDLSLGTFIKLVNGAENNIYTKGDDANEKE